MYKRQVEDIPDPESAGKDNTYRGSLLPTLNKKLIANSLNILFDLLQKTNHKGLTTEVSSYLMTSVYKMFRILYSANAKNPQGLFAAPEQTQQGLSSAAQCIAEANAICIASGNSTGGEWEGLDKTHALPPVSYTHLTFRQSRNGNGRNFGIQNITGLHTAL